MLDGHLLVAIGALLFMASAQVEVFDLAGTWTVTNGSSPSISATVPGLIHTDLLAANIIGISELN
jgi:hypothetical protein